MIYLLDTNHITALAQGNAKAIAHLQKLAHGDDICTCFVVVGEWEYGILNAVGVKKQNQIRAAGLPLFNALSAIWDSTPAVARRYGAVHAALRAAGQMIPTNDVWIAATALEYGATLATSDPHFQRVPGLTIVNWT